MGNGPSSGTDVTKDYIIDEDPIVTSSQWTLHHAQSRQQNTSHLVSQYSVFIGPKDDSVQRLGKVKT